MAPALDDGAQVLVDPRAFRRRPPREGDVVLCRHPYRRDVRLVKRVAAVTASGALELRGDNPDESTDSRSFGAVPRERLIGRVVCVLT